MGDKTKGVKEGFSVVVFQPRRVATFKDIHDVLKDTVVRRRPGDDKPYVTLDTTIPWVQGKGALSFTRPSKVNASGALFTSGPFSTSVVWEGEQPGSGFDLDIVLIGLTNAHRYVLYVDTYAHPSGPNPEFEIRMHDRSTKIVPAPFTGRPGLFEIGFHRLLCVFAPLTPTAAFGKESGRAWIQIKSHQTDVWHFFIAAAYDIG